MARQSTPRTIAADHHTGSDPGARPPLCGADPPRLGIPIIIIVTALLLGGVALHAIAPVAARSGRLDLSLWYTVEQGTASGQGYRLESLNWQVSGTASGAGYRLLGPDSPSVRGNGCCCTYLPLALQSF